MSANNFHSTSNSEVSNIHDLSQFIICVDQSDQTCVSVPLKSTSTTPAGSCIVLPVTEAQALLINFLTLPDCPCYVCTEEAGRSTVARVATKRLATLLRELDPNLLIDTGVNGVEPAPISRAEDLTFRQHFINVHAMANATH